MSVFEDTRSQLHILLMSRCKPSLPMLYYLDTLEGNTPTDMKYMYINCTLIYNALSIVLRLHMFTECGSDHFISVTKELSRTWKWLSADNTERSHENYGCNS